MIQLVGYLGSAGAALMWTPQAVHAVRHRHDATSLGGISLATYAWAVVFNALLLTYGLLSDAAPVVLAGCINVVCAAVIVTVLLGRKAAR